MTAGAAPPTDAAPGRAGGGSIFDCGAAGLPEPPIWLNACARASGGAATSSAMAIEAGTNRIRMAAILAQVGLSHQNPVVRYVA